MEFGFDDIRWGGGRKERKTQANNKQLFLSSNEVIKKLPQIYISNLIGQ